MAPAGVREALAALSVADLQELAAMIGRRGLRRKQDLLVALTRHLTDGEQLRREVAKLADAERSALREAVHGWQGTYDPGRMVAKYGADPLRRGSGRLRLFFLAGHAMPEVMRTTLASLVEPPPAAVPRASGQPPSGGGGSFFEDDRDQVVPRLRAAEAQGDLLAVLRLCQGGRLRCSETTRRPTSATALAITAVLAGGDFYPPEAGLGPVAAFAWPLLLQAAGLAELAGGRLTLTRRGLAALDAPAADTLRKLWERWLRDGPLDEFSRVEVIKGQSSGSGRALTAVHPRRRQVAAGLAACPQDGWITVDDFFAFMVAAGHDPVVARDPWRLYIGELQYGSLGYEGFGEWPLLQGRYVMAVLFEYAATLGLIDVAYRYPHGARDDYTGNWGTDDLAYLSRYDGLRAFRVNGLGAYALGRAAAYRPAASTAPVRMRVLPNLDLVVTGPRLPAADGLLLSAYAEQTGDATWRLDRGRILAAVASGRPLAELRAFLQARAEGGLPEAAATFLDDIAARAGQLRDRGLVRLVECQSSELATRLAADRRLAGACWQVGERFVAVPLDAEAAFRRRLLRLGYALAAGTAGVAPAAGRDLGGM